MKTTAYRLLDIVTLGRGVPRRIGRERVRFPALWSRYYESDYETETFQFFRSNIKPGWVVFDIGAHIGLFTVLTSRLVESAGRIFAFEPTPFTRGVLEDVVRLNNCESNVEIRPEAVSSEKGTATFFDTGNLVSNANSLVRTERSQVGIEVPVTTVDDFVAEQQIRVDCLKIDVEGAELNLLRGAANLFRDQRPIARLGLHPESIASNNQSLEEIWELLSGYRYRIEYNGQAMEKEYFCSQPTLFDVNLFPYD